ncbi:MAG: carboxypeptidase-like regulatory domain-containing protein [Capnocytophaga sp.]|nr:carboxypeptidase-like regulatory domain-containing protein [Capnocytophaga sp.]
MNKTVFSIVFFFGVLPCLSQTILRGTVRDSLQNPVVSASVIAQPKDSTQTMRFSITDRNGQYELKLSKTTYRITVSHMSFRQYSFDYQPSENNKKDIVLQEGEMLLDEVVVESPIVFKQDTTIYDARKFMSGDERKLKNILNKLPGIEVDKDGNVTVQGQKISAMLVEGKEFFGGGSKLAVENIPADAVDKVEVLENYNKIAFLKNLGNSDEIAMNITLREEKKNFVFGNLEAGKGNRDYYQANSKLFYYSPKTKANFIGDANNTAQKAFTYNDYLNFSGGNNPVFRKSNNPIRSSDNDFLRFLGDKDLTASQNRFGAINITQEAGRKATVAGYVIISHADDEAAQKSVNQYSGFTENKSNLSDTDNLMGIGRLTLEYLPNAREQWHFNSQFKKTKSSDENAIRSDTETESTIFATAQKMNSVYFSQNAEWHRNHSGQHIFSFAAGYTYDRNRPDTRWQTSRPMLGQIIPWVNQSSYILLQSKETQKNTAEAVFKHFWMFHKNHHLYFTAGNTFSSRYFTTHDRQQLTDETFADFSGSGFGNDANFRLNDLHAGVDYKFRRGVMTFKQGLYLHGYSWKTSNQDTNTERNKIILLPDLEIKADFRKLKKLQFNYSLNTAFADVPSLANRFYLQSYNSVFRGNEALENELYHSLRLRYSQGRTYRGITAYAIANYVKKVDGIRNSVVYQGVNQYLTPIMIHGQDERWSFLGNIKKNIFHIHYNLTANYSGAVYQQEINLLTETNRSHTAGAKIAAKTLFDNFPTVQVSYGRNLSRYTLSGNRYRYTTGELSFTADYAFGKGFIFNFEYASHQYRSANLTNRYEIAGTVLSYQKENSAWSYKITVDNLMNTGFKRSNSFTDYYISDSRIFMMPRVIMASIAYHL